MHFIALTYIFDKGAVSYDDQVALQESIDAWTKIIDLPADEKWELRRIVNALIANEKGYFDRSKLLQIEHQVDYRKMYKTGLPFVLDMDKRTSWNKA